MKVVLARQKIAPLPAPFISIIMFLAASLLVKIFGAVPTALLAHGVILHLPGQCRTSLMDAIAGVDEPDALIVFYRLAG
jgi:hypothetical protein